MKLICTFALQRLSPFKRCTVEGSVFASFDMRIKSVPIKENDSM